jgi:TatA/E family protein of Tat protein translocase
MSIFGISPIELLLIAVVGLVVFGPERLPGMGRSLGRFVARILAWQYTSPEAQLLMQLRRDLEQEINGIRDELIRAQQAIDIRPDLEEIRQETESLIRQPFGATAPAESPMAARIAAAARQNADAAQAEPGDLVSASGETLVSGIPAPTPGELVAVDGTSLVGTSTDAPSNAPPQALQSSEMGFLITQIQGLTADLHALRDQLRSRGLLDETWPPRDQLDTQPADEVGV